MAFSVGMLILRAVVGLYLFGHGTQKLFGWFGGGGMQANVAMVRRLGMRPLLPWALAGGLGEALGGVLIALGLVNPVGSIVAAAAMLTASVAVHLKNGVWSSKGGFELPLTNLAAALAVGLASPGDLSLDHALDIRLPEPGTWLVLGGVTLVVTLAGLLTRRPAPSPEPGKA